MIRRRQLLRGVGERRQRATGWSRQVSELEITKLSNSFKSTKSLHEAVNSLFRHGHTLSETASWHTDSARPLQCLGSGSTQESLQCSYTFILTL